MDAQAKAALEARRGAGGRFGTGFREFGHPVGLGGLPPLKDRLVAFGYARFASDSANDPNDFSDSIRFHSASEEDLQNAIVLVLEEASGDESFTGAEVDVTPVGDGFDGNIVFHKRDEEGEIRKFGDPTDLILDASNAVGNGDQHVTIGLDQAGRWRIRGSHSGKALAKASGARWVEVGQNGTIYDFADRERAEVFLRGHLKNYAQDPATDGIQVKIQDSPGFGSTYVDDIGGNGSFDLSSIERSDREQAFKIGAEMLSSGSEGIRIVRGRYGEWSPSYV
jgi:hypothetical protein